MFADRRMDIKLPGCDFDAPEACDDSSLRAAIKKNVAEYFDRFNAHDAEGIVGMLSTPASGDHSSLEDWAMPDSIVGRQLVGEMFAGIFNAVPGISVDVSRLSIDARTLTATAEVVVFLDAAKRRRVVAVDVIEFGMRSIHEIESDGNALYLARLTAYKVHEDERSAEEDEATALFKSYALPGLLESGDAVSGSVVRLPTVPFDRDSGLVYEPTEALRMEALVLKYFDNFNALDAPAVAAMLHPDAPNLEDWNTGGAIIGVEAIKGALSSIFEEVPAIHVEVQRLAIDGAGQTATAEILISLDEARSVVLTACDVIDFRRLDGELRIQRLTAYKLREISLADPEL
jgi:ketosteroid isomerase-like protein